MTITKLISGGQTGVDRAGLDVARKLGLPHGGSCPAGRRAEDGVIPSCYELDELDSWDYSDRTRQNVLDADATLILTRGAVRGGTRLTQQFCQRHGKPLLVIDLDDGDSAAVTRALDWLSETAPSVLNIAGPRESQNPGIAAAAERFLGDLLSSQGV